MPVNGQAPDSGRPTDFEALAQSAAAARDAGKNDEAIRDYRRALELRPDWSEGWWYVGTLEYDRDQYADAAAAFQKLVELVPSAGPGWNFLGLCEFETKDYEKSLAHLKKGQALGDGDDPEIARVSKYHLALLLIRNGDFEPARTLLGATFGRSQVSPQVKLALGLALLRVPLLPEEVDPSQDALVQAAGEATAIAAQGDTTQALNRYRLLAKEHPGVPYLHFASGQALASAGQLEEALAQQREELKTSPKSALPRIEMSQLLLRLRRPAEAVRAGEEAVQLAPDSQEAHQALGRALQEAGRKERAAEELAAADKLGPEAPHPEERIAQLYGHQLAPSDARAARSGATQTAADPGAANFEEYSRQAAAAQAAGQVEQAVQNYEHALQLRPDWDDGRWALAMLCYSTARYPEATAALRIWVKHKPGLGTAWAVMGLSEFQTKDYSNALIHLQRGAELGLSGSKDSVRLAKYHLAILLNRNGRFEEAIRVLAPEDDSGDMSKQIEFALGSALLRMALLPDEIEASKSRLVQSAGEIAVLLQESKYDQAFPKFQILLNQYPKTPFLHYAYGTALLALSQFDEAEAQLRKELEFSSSSELPYLRLASLKLKKHRPEEALPFGERAVELAKDSAEAHFLLGRASFELGHEEAAVAELETASRLAPSSPEVHFILAKAYAKAKLPEKAEQERAIFGRLNALAEQQRSRTGNQAYAGAHPATDFTAAPREAEKSTASQHP